MREVRTETAKFEKILHPFMGYFHSNMKVKRQNPYWAQEQTLRQAQGKALENSIMNFKLAKGEK